MKKKIILGLLVLIGLFTITGCKTKSIPFFEEQNGILTKDYKQTFENPLYFYTINDVGDIVELDGVEFVKNPLQITFSNWKMSKPDKDGNVVLSFDYKLEADIEVYAKRQTSKWYYTYISNGPLLYDYYTGEIYTTNNFSEDGSRHYQNGALTESKKEFKYTNIDYGDKTVRIGIYTVSSNRAYKGLEILDPVDGKDHYKDHGYSTYTVYVKMPKDYTGVMLVVNKKGSDKSLATDIRAKSKKIKELEDKYGKDCKEVKELEKESEKIHKLVDSKDEIRKQYSIKDYYHIKLADVYNIKEEPKKDYTLPIIIVASSIILIAIIVLIVILKKKKTNKNNVNNKKVKSKKKIIKMKE